MYIYIIPADVFRWLNSNRLRCEYQKLRLSCVKQILCTSIASLMKHIHNLCCYVYWRHERQLHSITISYDLCFFPKFHISHSILYIYIWICWMKSSTQGWHAMITEQPSKIIKYVEYLIKIDYVHTLILI